MTDKFEFLRGCALTLWPGAISTAIGLAIGLVTVWAMKSRHCGLRTPAAVYIKTIRDTPFLLQIYFIYFGMPSQGLKLQPWTAAIVALSLNLGAFSAEIIQGGIEAVPRGQIEAGSAPGLSLFETFRFVEYC